jgi:hypothetical protein
MSILSSPLSTMTAALLATLPIVDFVENVLK